MSRQGPVFSHTYRIRDVDAALAAAHACVAMPAALRYDGQMCGGHEPPGVRDNDAMCAALCAALGITLPPPVGDEQWLALDDPNEERALRAGCRAAREHMRPSPRFRVEAGRPGDSYD